MASLGHVVVGLAATRFAREGQRTCWSPVTAVVIWSGLSMLPDADVVAFRLGIPYEAPWGHRGATHSLVFAVIVGLAVSAIARWSKLPGLRTALLATAVIASHPLLDMLTDGGLGCAIAWPFDTTRHFFPWTPLPVAPIGSAFLSREGAEVALFELAAFAPLLIYAAWPVVRRGLRRV